jgi:hypothetical protein
LLRRGQQVDQFVEQTIIERGGRKDVLVRQRIGDRVKNRSKGTWHVTHPVNNVCVGYELIRKAKPPS